MRLSAPLSLLYFSILAGEIYAEIMEDLTVIWLTKPLLMPILLFLFIINSEKNPRKESLFFAAALVFSLAGDVFLMFRKEEWFVFGLASFLLGHIAYILSFLGRVKEAQVPPGRRIIFAIPFLAFVGGFLWFLKPHILDSEETAPFFPPVAVYASVIGFMGYMALLRKEGVYYKGFWAVFGGALLFIFSDCCIAINKFVEPIPLSGLIIMSTYGVAQYLMTIGTLKSNKKHHHKLI
jgi:uncharacterized membrane protein YhhN